MHILSQIRVICLSVKTGLSADLGERGDEGPAMPMKGEAVLTERACEAVLMAVWSSIGSGEDGGELDANGESCLRLRRRFSSSRRWLVISEELSGDSRNTELAAAAAAAC